MGTYYSFRKLDLSRAFGVKSALFLSAVCTALLLLLLPAGADAMGAKGVKQKSAPASDYIVIDGFSSPESVISDGKRFYVSNVGVKLAPSVKDNDGFISSLSPDGTLLERKFITGLNAPKGMAIIGDVLYVADVDRVAGFDLKSRKLVFTLDFSAEGTVFLNDITVVDADTLLVSATDIGKVYAVTLGENKRYTPVVIDIAGVNGLKFDAANKRLFIVSFTEGKGMLSVIPFVNGPGDLKDLTGPLGMLDGVALLPDGRLLFSDWVKFGTPGRLYLFDMESGELRNVELKEESIGPADFFYDHSSNKIWMPRMVEGKVMIQDFK